MSKEDLEDEVIEFGLGEPDNEETEEDQKQEAEQEAEEENKEEETSAEKEEEKKPEIPPELQGVVDGIVSSRVKSVKTKYEAQLERERSEKIAAFEEQKRLQELYGNTVQSHNKLVDTVNKDELTEVPEDLRKPIEIKSQPQNTDGNFLTIGELSQNDMQAYRFNSRQFMVEALEKIENPIKVNLISEKYKMYESAGMIPPDVLVHLGDVENGFDVVNKIVDDELFRQQIELSARRAKNARNPSQFKLEFIELAKSVTNSPTPSNKRKKPKTESAPGRKQGSGGGKESVEEPVIEW